MGYTTDFEGRVNISPPLNEHEISFLQDLATTRRMARTKGPLFVKGSGDYGQGKDDDVANYNGPPSDQPGLWLQWVPTNDGTALEWDQGEKFYNAPEWMVYLIDRLLSPRALAYITDHADEDPRLEHFTCNHTLDGEIEAQGEDPDDRWKLVVTKNEVSVAQAHYEYGTPSPLGRI